MPRKLIAALLSCMLLLLCACASGDPSAAEPELATEPILAPSTPEPTAASNGVPAAEPALTEFQAAYELYSKVLSVTSVSADEDIQAEMDVDMTIRMDFKFFGETSTEQTNVSGSVEMIAEDGVVKYHSLLDMDGMGEDGGPSVVEMYFDGERGVVTVDGEPVELSDEDFMDSISDMPEMPEFPESAIKSVNTRMVGDNEETTIIVDGTELSDYVLEAAGDSFGNLEMLGVGLDFTVDDVKMVLVNQPDGTPVSFEMDLDMEMSILGIEVNMTMSMSYVFVKYGSGVEIDFSKMPE